MEVLFKLLRLALGTEADASLPEGVDWPALVELASQHGVAALAYDGLQKCYEADPRLVLPLDREFKQVKYDWFGAVLNVEIQYEAKWNAVVELAQAFTSVGLRTLVLKGFLVSSCYPVPQHRYSCDFDCFLMGEGPVTDREAYELGNRTMEASGVKVDRSHYKHSSFHFKGINVENHQFLTGWRGSRRWKRFELELEGMLEGSRPVEGSSGALGTSGAMRPSEGLRPVEGTSLLVGPPLFNALFLTRHAHQHFLIEDGISLRHVCDWAMFLRRYHSEFDWDEFLGVCARYGLDRFACSMTRLAAYVCGVDVSGGFNGVSGGVNDVFGGVNDVSGGVKDVSGGFNNVSGGLLPEDGMLLNDILTMGQRFSVSGGIVTGSRSGLALKILRSGWKFRYFSDETRLGCLLRYVWGYFFVKAPRL